MSDHDKSVIFRAIKYSLVTIIAVFVGVLTFLLVDLIIVTSDHANRHADHSDAAVSVNLYETSGQKRHLSHSFIVLYAILIAVGIAVQLLGLIGAVRENVFLLLVYGILTSVHVFIEFSMLFTHSGNALNLVFATFLAVITFVFIHVIRNERRSLPRVHYIPAPTNPYNDTNYNYFPQPNVSLYKDPFRNI